MKQNRQSQFAMNRANRVAPTPKQVAHTGQREAQHVQALKDQAADIAKLSGANEALRADNEALKAENETLKADLAAIKNAANATD